MKCDYRESWVIPTYPKGMFAKVRIKGHSYLQDQHKDDEG